MKASLLLVNSITLSRIPIGILMAVAYSEASFNLYVAPAIAYLFFADLLDGTLARGLAVVTRAGGVLDYVVDRFNYYLAICLLVRSGISPFLFVPFFLRDLVYVSVQVYVSLPSVRGTKAVSFAGTAAVYGYLLILAEGGQRRLLYDSLMVVLLMLSLANLTTRVYRLRSQLLAALREDLGDPPGSG